MESHNEIQEMLVGFVLGELSEEQCRLVSNHSDICAKCRQKVESLRLVLDCAGQMADLSINNSCSLSSKDLLFSRLSQEKNDNARPRKSRANNWRTIMKSRITKFAAAVVIFSVLLGLSIIGISPDGSSVAWANLVKHLEEVKTVAYRMHMTMEGMPGASEDKPMEMDGKMIMSSDYGMRTDMIMDGRVISRMHMLFAEKSMVTIMPEQKKFIRITLTDELREKARQDSYDPKKMVAEFTELDYVELGRKEIDGVEVEGIEVNDPKISGGMFPKCIGRLWVDIETDLPVQMEVEFRSENGTMDMRVVINNFEWGGDLDESEFAYVIPADYQEMADIKMPEMNARTAVEGFKMLMKINGGNFPKNLNMIDVMQNVTKIRMEQMKDQTAAIKKAEEAGIDPNTIPEDKKINKQQLINEQMKIQGVCMFYAMLISENKDPAYYGDRITPQDSDAVLMRWQNDKDGYTVIFGNLSIENFTPEELGKMEAGLPGVPAE